MRKVIAIALASLLLVSAVPAPAVAHEGVDTEGVQHQTGIIVSGNGEVTVIIAHIYDLGNEQEKQAFESTSNESLQQKASNIAPELASSISESTGRDVQVIESQASRGTQSQTNTGRTSIQITLSNIPAENDAGNWVITQPIQSGYYDNFGNVILVSDDAGSLVSATPEPNVNNNGMFVWEQLSPDQYSDFKVVLSGGSSTGGQTTDSHNHDSHEHTTTDSTNNQDSNTQTPVDAENSNNNNSGPLGGLSTTALGGIAVVLVIAIGAGAFLLGRNSGGE